MNRLKAHSIKVSQEIKILDTPERTTPKDLCPVNAKASKPFLVQVAAVKERPSRPANAKWKERMRIKTLQSSPPQRRCGKALAQWRLLERRRNVDCEIIEAVGQRGFRSR